MATIIMSHTMQAFLASGVPEFGDKKPFTLTMGAMDFEAITWWNANDYFTIGIVLTDKKYLLTAVVTMHDYIENQWRSAIKDYRNGESDDMDSMMSFPYYMALIAPTHLEDEIKRFKAPECFELYVVEMETNEATCYIGAPE